MAASSDERFREAAERRIGKGARIVDENADRPHPGFDVQHKLAQFLRSAEVRTKCPGIGPERANLLGHELCLIRCATAVDGHAQAMAGKLARDRGAGARGGTGHECRQAVQPRCGHCQVGFVMAETGAAGEAESPAATSLRSSPSKIFSAVIGSDVIHLPVAAAMAFATVAGGSMQGGSPTPLAP
jgi:hypothetical protein